MEMSKTTEPKRELDIRTRAGYDAAIFAARSKLAAEARWTICPGCGWPMMHRCCDGLHSYTCEVCEVALFARERPGEDEIDAAQRLGVLV